MVVTPIKSGEDEIVFSTAKDILKSVASRICTSAISRTAEARTAKLNAPKLNFDFSGGLINVIRILSHL